MRTPAFYLCLALATLCGIGAVIADVIEPLGYPSSALWICFVLLISVSVLFLESDPAQEPN